MTAGHRHAAGIPARRGRPVRWLGAAVLLFTLIATLGGVRPALAGDAPRLILAAGAFDFFRRHTHSVDFRAELITGRRYLGLFKPLIGVEATNKGSLYGYVGLAVDFYFGRSRRFVATPHTAVGYYSKGGKGKDLGGPVEFRSGFELAYRFADNMRIGVAVSHTSNAGLYKYNPGAESLIAAFHWPLGDLFGN